MTEAMRATIRILLGDCRKTLLTLDPESVHCVVTSPPYLALRSYLPDGHPDKDKEIGSEKSIEDFVATMVHVFAIVGRVLRSDGVLWVNLGDKYADDKKWGGRTGGLHRSELHGTSVGRAKMLTGLKPGDQCLIPHRFAFAMQDAGWHLRSTVIWRKASPVPEAVSGWRWVPCRRKTGRRVVVTSGGLATWDMGEYPHGAPGDYRRQEKTVPEYEPCPGCKKCQENGGLVLKRGRWRPTSGHEYLFQFTKSKRYFSDGDAVAEPVSGTAHPRGTKLNSPKERAKTEAGEGFADWHLRTRELVSTRNPRTVMSFPNEPYKGAHFATFPSGLPAFCIRSSTSAAGCCPKCGNQYAPVVTSERVPTRPGTNNKIWKHDSGDSIGQRSATAPNLDPYRHVSVNTISGHLPTCRCNAGPAVPATVLDCFLGTGTTLQAARVLGRSGIGCELFPEYVALAETRIATDPKWAKEPRPKKPRIVYLPEQSLLDFEGDDPQ